MGQAAIPIMLAIAAAGVSAYNTSRTARKQDSALAESMRRQGEIRRQANQELNKTLGFFEESGPEEIQAQRVANMRQQLAAKRAIALAGLQQPGGVSDAAKQAADAAGLKASDYGGTLAGLFSRIDAPVEQRRREGFERADLGGELSILGRNSAAEDFLNRLRLQGIRRSPWLDILSAGLSGASSGIGFAGGGGGGIAGAAGSGMTPQQFYSPSASATLPGLTGQSGQLFRLFGP